jgi:ABC-type multidrug transport system fused ATPase/permease subunit
VGPSGAGKSTVFALLERFYEADSGAVLLDGVDVRALPLDELRNIVGYVEQDSPVMAGSVRSNLLYANPGASEEELEEVLDLASLRPFVERLPRGLETEVGDGGVMLSGGERQRVAIARVLLLRPRLLLLDEVTSQLDAANELALQETLSRVSEERTVMVIAHRLSTVVDADRIVVLDEGRVKGIGTHEELLASNQLYRKLAASQFAGKPSPRGRV